MIETYSIKEMPPIAGWAGLYYKNVAMIDGTEAAARLMRNAGLPIQAALGLLVYNSYEPH